MRRNESWVGRTVIVLGIASLGLATPVLGQGGSDNPDRKRSNEIFSELVESGRYTDPAELASAWIDALRDEFGPEHAEVFFGMISVGNTLYARGLYRESLRWVEQQVELSTKLRGGEHPDTLTSLNNLAQLLGALGDRSRALEIQKQVFEARSRVSGPEHPRTLTAKANLAATLYSLGDLSGARRREEEILETRHRLLGPDHPDTLSAKANLAATLRALGDLSGARGHEEEVLEAFGRLLGPDHLDTLTAKANLAATLQALGDLSGARRREEEVLEAFGRLLGPDHPGTLQAKGNLAVTLRDLGDFSGARRRQEEVLEARHRLLGPDHPHTLTAKANLAATLYALGDFSGARRRYEEVLESRIRRQGPDHPHTLTAKANLAATLQALGDLSGARRREEEVLEAFGRLLGPDHPDTLTAKANLAGTLHTLGDLPGARRREEEVLEARRRVLGPEHPATVEALHNLATTLADSGDHEGAVDLLERAILLRRGSSEDYRPNTLREASTFFFLGANQRVLGLRNPRDQELLAEAFASFSVGLDALEAQTLRADFSEEVRIRYKARYAGAYRDTLAVGLESGRVDDAFHVLERYRAQSLLDLLRWSRPGDGTKIPEVYREELASIAARYDQLTRKIADVYPTIDQALIAEQVELRRRREVVQGQILEEQRARADPPTPLRVDAIRRHLDPGTLMLAYSIGGESRHLFVLDRDGPLEVHSIEAEVLQLWVQVGRLRESELEGSSDTSRDGLSRWLYDRLLAPAAERIARAERLLILPDGPLHYLHFAALTRPNEDDPRGWEYLVEHKPIHTVQSATVYAELQARRPDGEADERAWQWAGFGDPVYPVAADTIAQSAENPDGRHPDVLRTTVERGLWDGLRELPNTEREIQEIARQFPDDQAIAYLDQEATEDRAREIVGEARIAHFAAHGLAHPEQPMDSFLALSLVDGDGLEHNGLLQAWEIVDHLQLDADLVVLSACVTAFGPNRGGEGLISLSRAFQIAGARTILASLWAVNDASTAELMIRFYRHLLAGQSKDEALRSAQLELIREPIPVVKADGEVEERDFSAPYHWAAFQLIGDWK